MCPVHPDAPTSMRLLAFCGSLRRASMNAALLRATALAAPAGVTLNLFDGLGELPLFNPDLEALLPPGVARLREAVVACDGLLIASPEYAHGVTGTLKNALDWLVSFEGFVGKPVAIFNASPRSLHAEASLREILATMSATIVAQACLALPLRGLNLTAEAITAAHGALLGAALQRFARRVNA